LVPDDRAINRASVEWVYDWFDQKRRILPGSCIFDWQVNLLQGLVGLEGFCQLQLCCGPSLFALVDNF